MKPNLNHAVHAVESTVDDAVARGRGAAGHAKTSVMEYGTQALKLVAALRALESDAVDSVLGRVGLARKPSGLQPVLWFAAGALVGGGAALALAPSIKTLRHRFSRFLDGGGHTKDDDRVERVSGRVPTAYDHARGPMSVGDGVEPLPRHTDGTSHNWR